MGEGGQGRCSSGSTGVNRAATLPPIGKLSLGKSNVSLDNVRKREGGSQYYRHSALKMHLLGMPFFMKGSLSSGKFEEWVSDYQFQISRC